ncbi:arabinosyltransferase domain-containing protein [Antrihabitans cavernicola]|uniref:Arabinosyltransferase n=1 Tax=Antrihabitans cavernicola TaxID=2495913 RepID=A0A5A7SA74_9NOCA|nr:arabinosyltransferase domain-containing protein [Spelaeibacter cavernicola]KAA0022384.1 arabinosyltransferase [Spelaeibacter cavernicola]
MRGWAIASALVAVLAALALPFLPVTQQQSSVSWPQGSDMSSVVSPLVTYAPQHMTANIPCASFDRLADSGGVVFSTIPRQSPEMEHYGMVVKVIPGAQGRVDVVSRNIVLWSSPLSAVRGQSCALSIDSDLIRTKSTLTSAQNFPPSVFEGDVRPQVVGIFTAVPGSALDGLHVDVTVDSRFSSSPTSLKLTISIVCALATLLSLIALHRLDAGDGRRSRRFFPRHWWRLRPVDAVVLGTLVVWHFIGANTSDDGYQLGMARGSIDSGFMSNYYRWFGVPESPFGTPYYDVLAWLAKVSTDSAWMRLPALLAGVLVWWVISREVIPRFGAAVRKNRVAVWTGALVFLAFWLTYNNGLRPEPLEATGVLLTWCSVERAIATRRLLPAAVALVIGALTMTLGPSGLVCFAALIAGARPLAQILRRRARTTGYLALLLPMLAAGLVILTLVFADQTLATVLEMTHVHAQIKPGEPWFLEYLRYQYLLQPTIDGSLTRRFGMFTLFLGLIVCVVTMLRRGGRIPGIAVGPSRRIIGITLSAFVLMMFTPTKWTHHFGIFAGLAGSVAVLTAVAVGPRIMSLARNRALFAAALFFLLAMCFVGPNGYWYVSAWGVPWWDKAPVIAGKGVSTFALGLTVLALATAAWFHIRPTDPSRPSTPGRLGKVPLLAVIAGGIVLIEVLSMTKAAVSQNPSYSIAKSNITETFGHGCGLADDVLIETDPNASVLKPLTGDQATALTGTGSTGFTPNGVAADLTSDETASTTGTANSVSTDSGNKDTSQSSAGTGGGAGSPGINGSTVALPFGLNPATTPVLGTYSPGDQAPASLTTGWYRLPAPDAAGSRGDIVSIAAAGRIRSVNADGVVTYGQDLQLEYGATDSTSAVTPLGRVTPIDIGPAPSWRNLRVPLDQLPRNADTVRIVAKDTDIAPDQWLAFTPPRVPQTQTLNDVVGSQTPTLLDWEVGLNFPCQRLTPNTVGIAQPPAYRILPDRTGAITTNLWQGHDGGGPLGWTDLLLAARTIPSYLNYDWGKDWGEIEQYSPLDTTAKPAKTTTTDIERSGWWTPGRINTKY